MRQFIAAMCLLLLPLPVLAQDQPNLLAWEALSQCAEAKADELAAIDNPISEIARAALLACKPERAAFLQANQDYYESQGDSGPTAMRRAEALTGLMEQDILDDLAPRIAEAKT